MRWFYNVKKRKRIFSIFLVGLAIALVVLLANFSSKKNRSEIGTGGTVIETTPPVITAEPKEPEVTPTPEQTPTPTVVPTLTPTAEPTETATPTPMETPTPEPTIAPTVAPTATVVPTPVKTTPKPTPTPKKTVAPKTKEPAKTPVAPPKAETKIELKYKNGKANANTDTIYPMFMISNKGNQSVKLSTIKIRYYYTKDGSSSETFWCDSFTKGSGNVMATFGSIKNKATADSYIEIGFSEDAGEIVAGESVELAIGFAKNDWSQYNQKDDYSYSSSRTYFSWNKVTLYLSGKLSSGMEP